MILRASLTSWIRHVDKPGGMHQEGRTVHEERQTGVANAVELGGARTVNDAQRVRWTFMPYSLSWAERRKFTRRACPACHEYQMISHK